MANPAEKRKFTVYRRVSRILVPVEPDSQKHQFEHTLGGLPLLFKQVSDPCHRRHRLRKAKGCNGEYGGVL